MKKIFRSFALVTAAATITRIISFIFKIYLSRVLGAELLGVYQIAISVVATLACISSSGVPVTLSRIVAENRALGNRSVSDSLLCAATVLSLSFALLSCAVFAAFPSLAPMLFSDERCVPVFYVMLPLLATTSLYSCLRGWFWGNKNYGVYAATELTDEIAKIVFSVLFLSGTLLAINVQVAYAYAMVAGDVVVVTMLIALFFVCGGRLRRPSGFSQVVKSSAPLTATRLCGSLVSTLISLSLPLLLCKARGLTTGEATAELGRATGMVVPLLFAPTAITGSLAVVIIPEFASFNAGKERDKIGSALSQSIKFSCVVSGFFFALFAGTGVALGRLLYDDELAGRYLCFAAMAMLPMGANGLCVSALNSLGKENATFASHTAGLALLLVTLFSTVWFMGVYAYFLAVTLSHTLALVINLTTLSKNLRLDKKQLLHALLAYAFCAVAALSLSPLSALLSQVSDILSVFVTSCVLTAGYAVYVWASGCIAKEDIKFFSSEKRKKKSADKPLIQAK